jgi:hypothetical protein
MSRSVLRVLSEVVRASASDPSSIIVRASEESPVLNSPRVALLGARARSVHGVTLLGSGLVRPLAVSLRCAALVGSAESFRSTSYMHRVSSRCAVRNIY